MGTSIYTRPETACIHAMRDKTQSTGAVIPPIYQSAIFAHPGFNQSTGYDYSRTQNPTAEHTEKLLAALEGGAGAVAFATGMAALSALMELFAPGDEIVVTDDLYGGTIRLFEQISIKNGLVIHYVDTSDLSAVEAALNDATRAVFIETPTNPLMKVTDIAGVRALLGERGLRTFTATGTRLRCDDKFPCGRCRNGPSYRRQYRDDPVRRKPWRCRDAHHSSADTDALRCTEDHTCRARYRRYALASIGRHRGR